ncbi:MAG: hypothetical protein M5R42_12590 [Rhodocyclaceae bacterium]|nr:hypothetical protein [Rhodocyclaceae bacterium]
MPRACVRWCGAPQVEVLGGGEVRHPAAAGADRARRELLRQAIGPRPVLLAASTREGEEALLFAAPCEAPAGEALLVVVPRHPQRPSRKSPRWRAGIGLTLQRRSDNTPINAQKQVLLGDSMGELFVQPLRRLRRRLHRRQPARLRLPGT